jgi:DNA mismatch repair protein MLH3
MPFSPTDSHTPTPFLNRLLKAGRDTTTNDHTHNHTCHHSAYNPTSEVTFSKGTLATATVLGQVDTKFIACLLDSPDKDRTLVLIDQHAADERVSVEEILQELCEGFINGTIHQTEVSGPAIVLTLLEAQRLAPGHLEIFARWGISLDLPTEMGEGDYVQVPIKAVPTLLASRLARKEASEMTRLVRLYLGQLDEDQAEVKSWLARIEDTGDAGKDDWQKIQRWMPKEMLELANSKACRSKSEPLIAVGYQADGQMQSCFRIHSIWINVDA